MKGIFLAIAATAVSMVLTWAGLLAYWWLWLEGPIHWTPNLFVGAASIGLISIGAWELLRRARRVR